MTQTAARARPLRLADPAAEALATTLLGGKRPTPPRVRALLQELDRRRKEIGMDPSTASPVASAPADDLTAEQALDVEETLTIAANLRAYAEHDEKVRARIVARPASAQRRGRIACLTEAAEVLLRELDLAHADRVREIARENGWEPWVVILGQVVRAADLNELAAGEFSPDWLNRDGQEREAPRRETCALCGHVIPGARKGQSACCSRHGSGKPDHNTDCPLVHVLLIGERWMDTRRLAQAPA